MPAPIDFQYFLDGCYYKVGKRGFVFVWTGDEWRRTTRPLAEIKAGSQAEERRPQRKRGRRK